MRGRPLLGPPCLASGDRALPAFESKQCLLSPGACSLRSRIGVRGSRPHPGASGPGAAAPAQGSSASAAGRCPRYGVAEAGKRGTKVLAIADIENLGLDKAAEIALEPAWEGRPRGLHLLRVDSVGGGFVPGTGWAEPGGLLPREALTLPGLVTVEGVCGLEDVEDRLAPPPPGLRLRRRPRAASPGVHRRQEGAAARLAAPARVGAANAPERNCGGMRTR